MTSEPKRARNLVAIPPEQVSVLAQLIRARGIVEASRASGIGRAAMLSIVARGEAMAGTAALLREFIARRGLAA